MKIKLQKPKPFPWQPEGRPVIPVKRMLPFYKPREGKYVHRVKSAEDFWTDGKYSHTGITMWCGHVGATGKGILYAKVPEGEVCCAICEGKAIGAGEDGARIINGRPVMFSPRTK